MAATTKEEMQAPDAPVATPDTDHARPVDDVGSVLLSIADYHEDAAERFEVMARRASGSGLTRYHRLHLMRARQHRQWAEALRNALHELTPLWG